MLIANESSLYLEGCEAINLGTIQSNASLFSFGSSPCLINGSLTVNSGSFFTAPSSILTIKGSFETSGSSFDANYGEVIFNRSTATGIFISGNPSFYNLSFQHLFGESEFRIDLIGSVDVLNSLKLDNGGSSGKPIAIYGGILDLAGNVDMNSYRSTLSPSGNGQIKFSGSENQTIVGTPSAGNFGILPHLHIAKTGGIFNITGNVPLGNGLSQSSGVTNVDASAHLFLHSGNFDFAGISVQRLTVSGDFTTRNRRITFG
jgi:hypothetical protein